MRTHRTDFDSRVVRQRKMLKSGEVGAVSGEGIGGTDPEPGLHKSLRPESSD